MTPPPLTMSRAKKGQQKIPILRRRQNCYLCCWAGWGQPYLYSRYTGAAGIGPGVLLRFGGFYTVKKINRLHRGRDLSIRPVKHILQTRSLTLSCAESSPSLTQWDVHSGRKEQGIVGYWVSCIVGLLGIANWKFSGWRPLIANR